MTTVSNELLVSWYTADSSDLILVSSNIELTWKVGSIVANFTKLYWDVRLLRSNLFKIEWGVLGKLQTAGTSGFIFSATHTGQFGSKECIRFRSMYNKDHIVYESPYDDNTNGFIVTKLAFSDPVNNRQELIASSYTLRTINEKMGEISTKLGIIDFPCYVYQEYASVTDRSVSPIRYLGVANANPNRSYTSYPVQTRISDAVMNKGIYTFEVNRTGYPIHCVFHTKQNQKRVGMVPNGSALAFVRTSPSTYKMGYIDGNVINIFGELNQNSGIEADITPLVENFTAFDGTETTLG